ncbi:MAG TPA: GDSL-type esterase/lipase family protein [bacterium]|nr:GDSL-type esterase/lipase family protein [bacterium]HQO35808.1 GDSL-type esterase/lipase family protein [bacterium]HQP98848.1 GDSL-type esterase/lipase family protein [bacterium]
MGREQIYTILAVAAALVSVLVFSEILCRTWNIGFPNRHATGDQGLFVPDPDPEISYRLKPGFEAPVYGAMVRVNSRGLRESESLAYNGPEEVYRILCLGDSVVFGFGIEQPEAFPAVLERLLTERERSDFEAINTGVPGYNTVQEVRFLETEGFRYHPRLVLLFLVINDPESTRTLDSQGNLLPAPEDIWLRLSQKYGALSPADTSCHTYNAVCRAFFPLTARYRKILGEAVRYQTEEIFTNPSWEACQTALAELRAWSESNAIPVVPVILPVLADFKNHPYKGSYDRLSSACVENGLAPVSAFEALSRYSPEQLRVHPLDGHPGIFGHRIIAEFLADTLKQQGFWSKANG